MTRKVRKYTDLEINIQAHPVTGDVVKNFDETAIKKSLVNLIMTRKFESPFHPEISSQVHQALFDPISPDSSAFISETVRNVINNFEPRAQILKVTTTADIDNNGYDVLVAFRIKNRQEPSELKLFLNRVR